MNFHLYQIMRLATLQSNHEKDPVVLQLTSFLVDVGEGNLQSSSSYPIILPVSIPFVQYIDILIQSVFPDLIRK